jgi:alpha-N-arabinofuranosidase
VCHGAEPFTVIVQADQPGAEIRPTLWGVFFEDINFAGDGGLYAELVKNRSFEFPDPWMAWGKIQRNGAVGAFAVLDADPAQPTNPRYLRVQVSAAGAGFGLSNEGFRGLGVRDGATYVFSVQARLAEGGPLRLRAELAGRDGALLAQTTLEGFGAQWRKHTGMLHASGTELRARLNLYLEGAGTLDLDTVSLFPEQTWRQRPNGLRADLVQMLAELRPGFVRFPGGCIVEGRDLATRYQWKRTLGDPAARPLLINRWNQEFKHRPTPDYFQSFGLGFFEFFQLCEDLGAEPLPILNCGMACQFNSGELVPLNALEPYVQDALDLVEFAKGPSTSPWGQRRAALGHPEPFGLKMLGVGNEQWGADYLARYERFAAALKTRDPTLALVTSVGLEPQGEMFDFMWSRLRELKADIVDEHSYHGPAWFFQQANRHAHYDRRGPKVFFGEYAAQSVGIGSPQNRNNLACALAEAAFMTGLERNAHAVVMSSYAPLFGHTDAWQWTPNLIWFDNLRVFGTPSYYVQQLFSRNRGDVVLPTAVTGPTAPTDPADRLYACASRELRSGEIILKIVNPPEAARPVRVELRSLQATGPRATAIVLAGTHPAEENSLDAPRRVAPVTAPLPEYGQTFHYTAPPCSLTVLRLPVK